jgi:hypothetical protein
MTAAQFDELLARLAARLRLRGSVARALPAAAVVLGADLAAVLALKLIFPAGGELLPLILGTCLVAVALCVLVVSYGLNSVSELRAAAELDRLGGLKERAASLVAVRGSGSGGGALRAALEADASRALEAVNSEAILARSPWLPHGARWLGVLLAAVLAALLVPARSRGRAGRLEDLLIEGRQLARVLQSSAGDERPEGRPRAETARKALAIIKAPPPRDPEEARRRRRELGDIAAELRKRGAGDIATKLEAAVRSLTGADRPGPDGGSAGPDVPAPRFSSARDRYPVQYRELLARYFAGGG